MYYGSVQFQSTQPYRVEFAIESKNEHSSEHRSGFADCSEYFKLHGNNNQYIVFCSI